MSQKNTPQGPTERQREVYEFYKVQGHSMQETKDAFGIAKRTVNDLCRKYLENSGGISVQSKVKGNVSLSKEERDKIKLAEAMLVNFSPEEIKRMAKSGDDNPSSRYEKVHKIDFSGERFVYGYIGDTHIGSKYFDPKKLEAAFDKFRERGVDFIMHGGDVTEGISHRPGHVYECTHVGYAQQKEESVRLLGQWTDTPAYVIDGNHDRWFIKASGAKIVEDICSEIPNWHFLGHDQATLQLDNGCKIQLWHGEDGSSYALSYRIQKVIESLYGGEKPHILHLAHTHKFCHIFERNIHAVSGGSIQNQSSWMKSKKLAAHTCFQVFDVVFGKRGVVEFNVTNYPFYV